MTLLEDGVRALDDIGLSDVLLPFVLVFTIVFAILQKTKILGDPKNSDQNKAKRVRGFNAMISFALALGVIIPHVTGGYPNGMDVVDIMNKALPNVSVVIVAVIMLLIMLNVLGTGKFAFISKTFIPWVALIAVVYIFLTAANVVILPGWLSFLRDRNTQSLLIMVLVFGLIYKFIVGSNEDDSLKGLEGEARKNKIKELEAKRLAKLYDALDKKLTMATALFSATIMERLLPMITFLFVFVVVYGFSKKTGFFGIFGDKDSSTGLAAIIAVLIAFIAILSKTFTIIVGLLVPWFMIITIAIFFILFVLKMFGLKDESMVNAVTKDATIRGWLIGIFITLVVIGMVISFGNDLLASTAITDGQTTGATTVGGESGSSSSGSSTHFDPDRKAELTATTSVATNIANTLTHPKVLGFIILFIIAFLAVFYLAAEP